MGKVKKKIAIVGAGIFGCTLSLILSKKYDVDLYERKPDILNEASMCNQLRYHEGFHYPRSLATLKEIKKSNIDFINFYGKDLFGKTKNLYAVSKYQSKTNFKKYLAFLKKNELSYKIKKLDEIVSNKIEGLIESNEQNLNYFKFKKRISELLKKSSVNIKLNSQLDRYILRYNNYDQLIIATYKNNNSVLSKLGFNIKNKFRYELVEKIIVKLPKKYKNLSIVVLDGNFICIDPYLGTSYHLISHVRHSKLKVINSLYPKFPKKYDKKLIQTKVIDLKSSKFNYFIKDGSKYLPFLKYSKYIFSYFVVRTIKYNVEKTSERTNLVNKINKNIITIMSGKWNTCVTEAYKIEKKLSKILR